MSRWSTGSRDSQYLSDDDDEFVEAFERLNTGRVKVLPAAPKDVQQEANQADDNIGNEVPEGAIDFIANLPEHLAVHIFSSIDKEPKAVGEAAQRRKMDPRSVIETLCLVSHKWNSILTDVRNLRSLVRQRHDVYEICIAQSGHSFGILVRSEMFGNKKQFMAFQSDSGDEERRKTDSIGLKKALEDGRYLQDPRRPKVVEVVEEITNDDVIGLPPAFKDHLAKVLALYRTECLNIKRFRITTELLELLTSSLKCYPRQGTLKFSENVDCLNGFLCEDALQPAQLAELIANFDTVTELPRRFATDDVHRRWLHASTSTEDEMKVAERCREKHSAQEITLGNFHLLKNYENFSAAVSLDELLEAIWRRLAIGNAMWTVCLAESEQNRATLEKMREHARSKTIRTIGLEIMSFGREDIGQLSGNSTTGEAGPRKVDISLGDFTDFRTVPLTQIRVNIMECYFDGFR